MIPESIMKSEDANESANLDPDPFWHSTPRTYTNDWAAIINIMSQVGSQLIPGTIVDFSSPELSTNLMRPREEFVLIVGRHLHRLQPRRFCSRSSMLPIATILHADIPRWSEYTAIWSAMCVEDRLHSVGYTPALKTKIISSTACLIQTFSLRLTLPTSATMSMPGHFSQNLLLSCRV